MKKLVYGSVYDDAAPAHKVPNLSDMVSKVDNFCKEVKQNRYDPKYEAEANKMLESFTNRTSAVESQMSDEEKAVAKKAYAQLDAVCRRFKMNAKLADSLGGAAEKIGQSGYRQSVSSSTFGKVINGAASLNEDVNTYIATLTEGIENLTEDTHQIDQLCEDIQDTVHKLVNKLEYVIADRVYPFDQYEVKAVDETQFYDDFQDNGDLNKAWDKYDEFCKASSEYEADTDYLEKVLDALRSIQTD